VNKTILRGDLFDERIQNKQGGNEFKARFMQTFCSEVDSGMLFSILIDPRNLHVHYMLTQWPSERKEDSRMTNPADKQSWQFRFHRGANAVLFVCSDSFY
jgi:hypothetical protein